MTLRQQAARGVFWSAAGTWGYHLATFLVFLILSRLLTPRAFGLIALAMVFVAFLKIVAEQGLADAIVQRSDIDREHLDTAFWATLLVGLVLAVLAALVAQLVAALLGEPSLGPVLAWLTLSLLLSGLSSVQRAILTRNLEFGKLTLRLLLSVLVGGIVGVVAAALGAGVWALVAQTLTTEAVGAVVLWGVSDWRPRFRFSFSRFRQLAAFGINVVVFRILLFVYRHADDLLIGFFLGPVALGFYAIAYRLLQIMTSVTTFIIDAVAFPVLAKIQLARDRVRSAYYEGAQFIALIAFPAFLGVALVAPELTVALFGEKWAASAPAMRLLSLGGMLQSILFLNGTTMKALGKPLWRVAITGMAAAVNVVAFLVVVRWGIVAVAGAFAVVTLLMSPVSFWAVDKLIAIDARTYLRRIRTPFVASLIMAATVLGLKALGNDLDLGVRFAALVLGGVASYVAAVWLIERRLATNAFTMARASLPTRRGHDGAVREADEAWLDGGG